MNLTSKEFHDNTPPLLQADPLQVKAELVLFAKYTHKKFVSVLLSWCNLNN